MRRIGVLAWSVLRHGVTVYAWALAAYTSAVLVRAIWQSSGAWALAPASVLAAYGALRWIWHGGSPAPAVRIAAVLAGALLLVVAADTGFRAGVVSAGWSGSLLLVHHLGGGSLGPRAVPVGAALRGFTERVALPVLAIAVAGTAARAARGLPPIAPPPAGGPSPTALALDVLELLVCLMATPAAFLAGASLTDSTRGATQLSGAVVAAASLPLGAYGFLRLLWSGIPTRDLRTLVWKGALVALLAAVAAITLHTALPALNSLRAAAGLTMLAVWVAAALAMTALRLRGRGGVAGSGLPGAGAAAGRGRTGPLPSD
jgi:hypothetical protein